MRVHGTYRRDQIDGLSSFGPAMILLLVVETVVMMSLALSFRNVMIINNGEKNRIIRFLMNEC